MTALRTPKSDDSLCRDVLAVMHAEQLNANAEFEVRDTQFIDAEVFFLFLVHLNVSSGS